MPVFNVCGQVYLAGGFDIPVVAKDSREAERLAKQQIEAMDQDALIEQCGIALQEVVAQGVTEIADDPEPATMLTARDLSTSLAKYVSADDLGLSVGEFLTRIRDRITDDLAASGDTNGTT